MNNLFKITKKFPIRHFFNMNMFRPFSTNQINEKESLELIESGVFEILKSAAKCKHDKLNRSATLEELGRRFLK
jgi:hypothetical protein